MLTLQLANGVKASKGGHFGLFSISVLSEVLFVFFNLGFGAIFVSVKVLVNTYSLTNSKPDFLVFCLHYCSK